MISLLDLTSNANHLINNGVVHSADSPSSLWRGSGKFVRASSQNLSAGNAAALRFTGDFSLEARIKRSSITQEHLIISKTNGVAVGGKSYSLELSSGNVPIVRLSPDGTNLVASACTTAITSLTDWYHIAVVHFAAAKAQRFYINGVFINEVLVNPIGSIASVSTAFKIGSHGDDTSFHNGNISEVRAWNDTRSDAEILANFNQKLVGNESGLAGYWRLEDPAGAMTLII